MCPPERLRDDRLAQGQLASSHVDAIERFAHDAAPPTMKRRISDTFLAVRDFAVTVLEARAEQSGGSSDDVDPRV
jgi:hypothetical protein